MPFPQGLFAHLENLRHRPHFLHVLRLESRWVCQRLVDKQDKELAVLIVVGKVVHDRVYCGPSGNWATGNLYGSLKDAKSQLMICRPDEDDFAKDFNNAFKTIGKIQSAIATSQDHRKLLIRESDLINNIRFSAPLFEQRPSVSELSFLFQIKFIGVL